LGQLRVDALREVLWHRDITTGDLDLSVRDSLLLSLEISLLVVGRHAHPPGSFASDQRRICCWLVTNASPATIPIRHPGCRGCAGPGWSVSRQAWQAVSAARTGPPRTARASANRAIIPPVEQTSPSNSTPPATRPYYANSRAQPRCRRRF